MRALALFLTALSFILSFPSIPARAENTGDGLHLVHCTDLHYLTPALTDHGPFFRSFISASDGKVMLYSEEITQAFVEEMLERHPDAVVLTGDLTYNGERESHLDLVKKLTLLTDSGIPVCVLPGNHDLDCPSAILFQGDSYLRVPSVDAQEFARLYAPFGYRDALSRDSASLSYVYALREKLWLLLLDVNAVPTPGTLPAETLAWVREQLQAARSAGVRVLSFSHQTLLSHHELFQTGYVIPNGDALTDLYREWNVSCNFCGHMHCQHLAFLPAPQETGSVLSLSGEERTVSFTEAVTGALCVQEIAYADLLVAPGTLTYAVHPLDINAWCQRHGASDENLLSLDQYARDFFLSASSKGAEAAFEGLAQAKALSAYLRQMNLLFFRGRMDLLERRPDLEALLDAPGNRTAYYMKTLLASPEDHTRFRLVLPSLP